MGFEKFTLKGRGFKPQVSIWSRGQISFNRGAINRYNIDQYKYGILYFDKEEKLIGIQLTNNENESGLQQISNRKSSSLIPAKGFLEHYNVDFNETRKYNLQKGEGESFLVIDLKEQEQ